MEDPILRKENFEVRRYKTKLIRIRKLDTPHAGDWHDVLTKAEAQELIAKLVRVLHAD